MHGAVLSIVEQNRTEHPLWPVEILDVHTLKYVKKFTWTTYSKKVIKMGKGKKKKGLGSLHYHRQGMLSHLSSKALHWVLYLVSWGEVFVGPWEQHVFEWQRRSAQHFVHFVHSRNNLAFDQLVWAGFLRLFWHLKIILSLKIFFFIWVLETEGILITRK